MTFRGMRLEEVVVMARQWLEAFHNIRLSIQQHPLWSVLGVATALVCGKFLCVYFGGTILVVLAILGAQKRA